MLIMQGVQASGGGLKARYAKVNERLGVPLCGRQTRAGDLIQVAA
jgi:hypothetical protein